MIYRCRNYGHKWETHSDSREPTACPFCQHLMALEHHPALPEEESLKKWPLPTVGPST